MYKERERATEFMKGERSDYTERQMLCLLEEIRADVRVLLSRTKEET